MLRKCREPFEAKASSQRRAYYALGSAQRAPDSKDMNYSRQRVGLDTSACRCIASINFAMDSFFVTFACASMAADGSFSICLGLPLGKFVT